MRLELTGAPGSVLINVFDAALRDDSGHRYPNYFGYLDFRLPLGGGGWRTGLKQHQTTGSQSAVVF